MPLSSQQKLLVLVLSIASVVALGLQIPTLNQQKAQASDEQKSQDISTLSTRVESYNSSQNELPKRLKDIRNLGDIESRIDNYTYTPDDESYKLCADFKTDTTQASKSSYSSYSSYGSSSYTDPYKHKKGTVCFTYNVYRYSNSYNSSNSSWYSSSSNSSSGSYTSIQDKSNDSERKTDIAALQSQLEAYYAQYGNYPTLTQVNDASWRRTNLKGLADAALADPENKTLQILTSSPSTNRYAYEPKTSSNKPCTVASECSAFTLTATLSDGSKYTKESF